MTQFLLKTLGSERFWAGVCRACILIALLVSPRLASALERIGERSPNTPTFHLAQSAVDEPREEKAWAEARGKDSEVAYINFLELFPAGRYAEDARRALERFDQAGNKTVSSPTTSPPAVVIPPPTPVETAAPKSTSPERPSPASPPAFSWSYQEASGKLTVNSDGRVKECTVANAPQLTGVGAYRANGELRVNFERRQNGATRALDVTIEEFCSPGQGVPQRQDQTVTPTTSQEREAFKKLALKELCQGALTSSLDGWDTSPAYSRHVAEANNRGMTVDSCRKALREVPAPANVGTRSATICNRQAPFANVRSGPSAQQYGIVTRLDNLTNIAILGEDFSPTTGQKYFKIAARTAGRTHTGYVDHEMVSDVCNASSSGPSRAYWAHNGSKMRLISNGSSRSFVYLAPRNGLLEVGVAPGTVLFTGSRSGRIFSGVAHVFKKGCQPGSFSATGLVSDDDLSVTLRGKTPILGASCQITGYREETLVFDYER